MDKQRQIEALARIEGVYLDCPKGGTIEHEDGTFEPVLCDYLNSHDAMQRVIDGLSYECIVDYHDHLYAMHKYEYDLLKATPEQKAEAVLKALGLWEDD